MNNLKELLEKGDEMARRVQEFAMLLEIGERSGPEEVAELNRLAANWQELRSAWPKEFMRLEAGLSIAFPLRVLGEKAGTLSVELPAPEFFLGQFVVVETDRTPFQKGSLLIVTSSGRVPLVKLANSPYVGAGVAVLGTELRLASDEEVEAGHCKTGE